MAGNSIVDALNDGRFDDPDVLKFLGAVLLGGIVLFYVLSSSMGAPASDEAEGDTKKNKKNKIKKKKPAAQQGKAFVPEPAEETAAPAKSKKKKNKKAKAAAEPAAEAPAEPAAKSKKKKNKKKAGSGEGSGAAGGAAKPQPTEPAKGPAKAAKKPAASEDPWDIVPSRDDASGYADDGWGTVTAKPKKKKTASSAAPSDEKSKTTVTVETRALHLVIGKGGATINKLKDATGVFINIPKVAEGARQPTTTTISLEGPADGVRACGEAIKDLTTKGICEITHGTFNEATVEVHSDYNQFLFSKPQGPSGPTVLRALETATNTQIKLGSTAKNGSQFYKIYGKASDASKVKQVFKEELLKNFHSTLTHPGMVALHMHVPEAQHRFIIGTKGSTIKNIQGNSKCKINLPGKMSRTRSVVIVGSPNNVKSAKSQIENVLTKIAEQNADNGDYDDYDDYDDDY